MTDPAWVPDTRPIPAELDDEYQAPTYRQPWATLEEKLADPLLVSQIRALARNAAIGEPETEHATTDAS